MGEKKQSNMPAVDFLFWLAIILLLYVWSMRINAQGLTLNNNGYSVYYDTLLNCPRQVRWVIRRADLASRASRKAMAFRSDPRCPRPRISSSDYNNSGYQRGHMCPAADKSYSREAMRETFLLSNIAPQVPALNMGTWKITEETARMWAKKFGRVNVGAAAIFIPEDTLFIGKHRAAVPHLFLKVIWVPDGSGLYKIWIFTNK